MPRAPEPVARLAWFLAGELVSDDPIGPNRTAAAELVEFVRGVDDAERHEPTLMAALMLGEAVDADPTNAALWGQYRAALEDVRKLADAHDVDPLAAIFGGPDLRNSS